MFLKFLLKCVIEDQAQIIGQNYQTDILLKEMMIHHDLYEEDLDYIQINTKDPKFTSPQPFLFGIIFDNLKSGVSKRNM